MTEFTTTRLLIQPLKIDTWVILDRTDNASLGTLILRNQWINLTLKPSSHGLGVATEATYAWLRTLNLPLYFAKAENKTAQQFLTQLGFLSKKDCYSLKIQNLSFTDSYNQLNQQLGISTDQLGTTKHQTTCQLVDSDIDCFQRPSRLNPHAHKAWQKMKKQASLDGTELQLASAFRSMRYQAGLIQRKLDQGQKLTSILETNTAPGHSEHHTGRAIDITTMGYDPLEESFEQSPAFTWLQNHAAKFGFYMTYPKGNKLGIIYEPWHWCFK